MSGTKSLTGTSSGISSGSRTSFTSCYPVLRDLTKARPCMTPNTLEGGRMKSMIMFWRVVLEEIGDQFHVSTARDFKTVTGRLKNEGDEFLTITLPRLAKDLEEGLDQGRVAPTSFAGFRRKGQLPMFLGWLLELIFDRNTGALLEEEENFPLQIDAIQAFRQLTLMFGKMEKPCTPEREDAAVDGFLECERELSAFWYQADEDILSEFAQIAQALYSRSVFSNTEQDVYECKLIPRHGPGVTADRLQGNQKWDIRTWPSRLEYAIPFGEYAIPNWRYSYLLDDVEFVEPGDELPVRVTLVPKTQKTPRIIAIEPTHMQYVQQALASAMVRYIERDSILSQMIGFDDQVPNQDMARWGSLTGALATLDLSEASDRVSYQLVKSLMARHPLLTEAVMGCRSLRADVPGYGVIPLSKFASMGSALTFPIEAMVFLTIIFHGISAELNEPVDRKMIKSFSGCVRVYGDDIIVPVRFVESVMRSLDLFGSKVNQSKSFWTGMFRESCGAEYFRGADVSVVRVRRDFPTSRADAQEIISLVSLRNQLYEAGYWISAKWLDDKIVALIRHFPIVEPSSPVLGRRSVSFAFHGERLNQNTQAPQVRGYTVSALAPKSESSGEGALLKCLTKKGLQPFEDVKHLERQGRPEAVRIKLRWASPF